MTHGWQEVPLGKVLKRADRFEKKDELQTYRFAGTYSFARGIFAGETKEGSTFRLDKIQRIKKGDFIYCKIMAWEGAFGIAPEKVDDCVMSGAFVAYEVDQTQIDAKFLDYYFKQEPIWKTIGSQSTGTNVRRRSLHPHQFEKATIPLPPLTEQRRIVARIESLAARVNEAQRLREDADAATNAITTSETTSIFEKLDDYPKIQLGKLGENGSNPIQTGPFGSQLLTTEFVDEGVPVLNVGNVQPDGLKLSKLDHVTYEKAATLTRYSLQENDLLFARTGATLGKVCLLPKGCDGWLMTGHLFRVRFDVSRCDPRYAFVALRGAESVRKQIFGQIRGATRPGFNTSLLSQVEIPLPPLDEQRRIVTYLDGLQAKVNALRELQVKGGEELSALMASILDKAFKGEL